MINTLLIANRGEIACRVIRTAKQLGIKTIAVYSDADKHALHVKMADEAIHLGPAPATESYLKAEYIIQKAKESGVDAIHPGYGFLSENAHFAKLCADNNIIFVGPSEDSIIAMGSKSAAKRIMQDAGVPLVPGYHGDNQDADFLHQQAQDIGYPVLLKAAAGGGGKGMRLVWQDDEFFDALEAAKREAKNSFGDDLMLVEKYLTEPRHIEIQVFCDSHGNGVYLFERDCSVQRRHQKIIEEAPAPNFPEQQRKAMGEAALRAASAINYTGAGTIEFLYDKDGSFYFMEMNTRLQVEHPVTEMITGEDLVAWQLMIADGQPLPKAQDELSISGHAFEARIYAEDPEHDFLPSTGLLKHLKTPTTTKQVRVDTGVVQGDEVSMFYDPMIAKLIVHADDRETALKQLVNALAAYEIAGVKTNIPYLIQVAKSQPFSQAQLTTDFISRHESLLQSTAELDVQYVIAAGLVALNKNVQKPESLTSNPFAKYAGYRLNHCKKTPISLLIKDNQVDLVFEHLNQGAFKVQLNQESYAVKVDMLADSMNITLGTATKRLGFYFDATTGLISLFTYDGTLSFTLPQNVLNHAEDNELVSNILAPMNGTIVDILVSPGDSVESGQTLAIIEAMKMEQSLKASADAKVVNCYFSAGDRVDGGATLIELESLDD
ncbi:acetyl-CoA carboxylase biotin carboxylase subunit [Glaciecola sp. 1036]|uniref:acetyl/propionyl/methylcrotonyl-CoA carboxylase subunit alpha n=1 Tax=Alteromonadaceae TaxID=72275 RepID=UPI003D019F05